MAITNRRVIWFIIVLWGMYWIFAPLLTQHQLFTVLDGLGAAISLAVCLAYMPGVWKALRTNNLRASHLLILGISCTWIAALLRLTYHWLWRAAGQPLDMLNRPLYGFFIWILMTGGVGHLIASESIEGEIPPRWWARLAIVVAGGMMATIVGLAIIDEVIGLPDWMKELGGLVPWLRT